MNFKRSGSSRCKLPPIGSEKEFRMRRKSLPPVLRFGLFLKWLWDNHRKIQPVNNKKVKDLGCGGSCSCSEEALVGSV